MYGRRTRQYGPSFLFRTFFLLTPPLSLERDWDNMNYDIDKHQTKALH